MANRRQVIQAGGAALALPVASIAQAANAAGSASPAIYRAIYDDRFEAGRFFAREATRRGWTTRAIRGDVTDVWFHELALRWKKGPAAITGLTTQSSLFVLERLAWDAGMRVAYQAEDPKTQLISWLIAAPRRA